MKKLTIALSFLFIFIVGCKSGNAPMVLDNNMIAMPEYYRRIIGYDSIQLVYGAHSKYNESKQDFDVTWDSLYANFCYQNEWEFEKFKKDTVYVHDTIHVDKVRDIYIDQR